MGQRGGNYGKGREVEENSCNMTSIGTISGRKSYVKVFFFFPIAGNPLSVIPWLSCLISSDQHSKMGES